MAYSEKQIEDIFEIICNRIIEGESLSQVLLTKGMPSRFTYYEWLKESDEKSNKYARATELRAEYLFDEILKISDNQTNDIIFDKDDIAHVNHDAIHRNRLQVDARKWALSKMNPKKYGEKTGIDVTTGGEKLSNKITIEFVDGSVKDL